MSLKTFCSLALLGLVVGVSARLQIKTETQYFIRDYQNNALTLSEAKPKAHAVVAAVREMDSEQKWVFKVSGDLRNTSTLYVIRPSNEVDSLTLDSDHASEHWYSFLFNWRSSHRWNLREIGDNQVEFINNRDGLCLQSNGLGKNVILDECNVGLPTTWTLKPVDDVPIRNASANLPKIEEPVAAITGNQ